MGEPLRKYKAADIQIDAIISKNGWHYPQTRMLALRDDVAATFAGTRPPQPLFFRANSNECIEFELTNLVPHIYELDDFQVRTPTDILGQHIHLVKFDVTSSDGSANGWNYEDGSFSPGEVRERIDAIRVHNLCTDPDPRDGTFKCPVALPHPFFGAGPDGEFVGAVTTVQRWMADDVLNNGLNDRTLRTVFTHDHFGPSTHQQAGLYAGLLVEPAGSVWRNPETGEILGSRADGGPTQFNVDILTVDPAESHREFMFEFADFQLAYEAGSNHPGPSGGGPTFPLPYGPADFAKGGRAPGEGFDDPAKAINPPAKEEAALPVIVQKSADCPGGVPLPCPEAVSAADVGVMSVNYRTEPVALRVYDPAMNSQAAGDAGDLAMVFRSDVVRADPAFNSQPAFYPPLTGGVKDGDPFTPLMRAYDGDQVQIRSMVGATEEGHNFSINGLKWLFEPSWSNSGWRASQMMGISEHFEFNSPITRPKGARGPTSDFLYKPGSATDDLWTGIWGILRSYRDAQPDLLPLPNNPPGGPIFVNVAEFDDDDIKFKGVCPKDAPKRYLDVTVALARDILPDARLTYNSRDVNGGPLNDPTAILYVRSFDLDSNGMLKPGVPVEPLILRANAGDCIKMTLRNKLPPVLPDLDGWSTLPMIVEFFNANDIRGSSHVGIHPQLLATDVTRSDGMNVGFNPVQTVPPGGKKKYTWYAGDLKMRPDGVLVPTPVEFGTVGLAPADPIKHATKGLVGVLIIEPENATWIEDSDSRASATVTDHATGTSFREFVLIFQSDVNMRYGDGSVIPNVAEVEDAEDSGHKAFNYRTEPTWFRMGYAPDATLQFTGALDFTDAQSNSMVGGDPETPVFIAEANMPVRFRIAKPGGNARNHVFQIHGHVWQFEPYVNDSTEIGDNPLSMWTGNQMGIGPSSHFDIVLQNGAGGKFGIVGDFLYRDMASFLFDGGLWGIFRVGDVCTSDADCDDGLFCTGEETCDVNGGCQAGDDPCPGLLCNEWLSVCVDGSGEIDNCPLDPLKLEPGVCGCGVPDIGDADADGVLDCVDVCNGFDDNLDADFDTVPDGCDICPAASDLAFIEVRARKHVVGSGSHPRTSKAPLVGLEVCAYDRSNTSCAVTTCGGISFSQYECIATSCSAAECCTTDLNGNCTMDVLPGDYIAIAYDSTREVLPDPLGRKVGSLGCGDTQVARIKQIIRADGRRMAAKVTVLAGALAGSELEIIEPEFMVWDEDEQQYPFVYDAGLGSGTWDVDVSTTPPTGFVADYAMLNNTVLDGTLEAAQFVITEFGNELSPTATTFIVTYEGQQQTVYSEVEIRLTEEYAESFGFDVELLQTQGLIIGSSDGDLLDGSVQAEME